MNRTDFHAGNLVDPVPVGFPVIVYVLGVAAWATAQMQRWANPSSSDARDEICRSVATAPHGFPQALVVLHRQERRVEWKQGVLVDQRVGIIGVAGGKIGHETVDLMRQVDDGNRQPVAEELQIGRAQSRILHAVGKPRAPAV